MDHDPPRSPDAPSGDAAPTFDTLPGEVLATIFDFLDLPALARARRTNRQSDAVGGQLLDQRMRAAYPHLLRLDGADVQRPRVLAMLESRRCADLRLALQALDARLAVSETVAPDDRYDDVIDRGGFVSRVSREVFNLRNRTGPVDPVLGELLATVDDLLRILGKQHKRAMQQQVLW